MKGRIFTGLLLTCLLVLQSTIFSQINYKGVHADLLLMAVVSGGLLRGRVYGASLGFTAGLLQDLASGTFFGMNTLCKLLVGYGAGLIEKQLSKENALLPFFAAVAGTLTNYFLMFMLVFLLGYRFHLLESLLYMMMPVVMQNILLIYPIHKMMQSVTRIRE